MAVNYNSPLIEGRLIKRYKRFLADVKLESGEIITAHCANTGAMTGCQPAGARVWLSRSENPKRKYPHSWELVELDGGAMARINTGLTNKVALEAVTKGSVAELTGYAHCHTEVVYGNEGSRVDLMLESGSARCFIEVKHVTLKMDNDLGAFPDAVSLRGQKHLRELIKQVESGQRAVMLFIIMRDDVTAFSPADQIDRAYGSLLREAAHRGVELLAYRTHITREQIRLSDSLPVYL
jgi:sugar fermentation stimulation protein A